VRLPKNVENDGVSLELVAEMAARSEPLWPDSQVAVPYAELGPHLESALKNALATGQIVRGFEGAERALEAEARGLSNVDEKTGVKRGSRISRLLVLADDGAERFYRNVEELLMRHAPRVLALRLRSDERALGQLLFGPDEVARLLLVDHKDAATAVLLALAEDWSSSSG
jgi:hypothetical protein